jgi:hypothetical protein
MVIAEQLKMDTNPFHFSLEKDGMIPGFIEGLKYLLVIRPFYSYPLT